MPRIAVVTAVRNARPYIESAVQSICNQTLQDFEYLIVDDASDDGTTEILDKIAKSDSRLKILRNESALGPYPSANLAIAQVNSPLIARMDGDDLSHPERLKSQVCFMDSHPDHMLVATSYEAIDQDGQGLYRKYKPADDYCVRWWMRFRMCAEHPTFCFRTTNRDNQPVFYLTDFPVGQDFEFLSRVSGMGKVAILPQILFKYRIHSSNITATRRVEQKSNILRIATAQQSRQLPVEVRQALVPFMSSYILGEKVPLESIKPIVHVLRSMATSDSELAPDRRRWIERQTAELIAHGLLKNGGVMTDPRLLATFLRNTVGVIPSLSMRILENMNLLPGWMESYPTIE